MSSDLITCIKTSEFTETINQEQLVNAENSNNSYSINEEPNDPLKEFLQLYQETYVKLTKLFFK